VHIDADATTGKLEANIASIKTNKRTARGYRNATNCESVILLRSAVLTAARRLFQGSISPRTERRRKASSSALETGRLPETAAQRLTR
jgi:hypothetical protein